MEPHIRSSHAPFKYGVTARDFFAGGFRCYLLPINVITLIEDALHELTFPEPWIGGDHEIAISMLQIETIIATISQSWVNCKCDDKTETDASVCTKCGGVTINLEELEGNMVTKVYIDYETNELVVQSGQCCEQRFKLLCAPGDDWGGDDDPPVIEPPPGVLDDTTACAKAREFCNVVFGVVDTLLDSAGVPDYPNNMFKELQSRYPYINFGTLPISTAYSAALLVATQGFGSEAENPVIQQEILCAVESVVGAGEQGFTEDEYNAARSAVDTVVRKWFTLATFPTAYSAMRSLYEYSADAIGKNDARKITEYAQSEPGDDCSCPGVEGFTYDQIDGGWYLDTPMKWQYPVNENRYDEYGNKRICWSPNHHLYGLVFEPHVVSGSLDRASFGGEDGLGCTADVMMTEHSGTVNMYPGSIYFAFDDALGQLLYATLGTSKTYVNLTEGERSIVVDTPACGAEYTAKMRLFGESNDGTGDAIIEMWAYPIYNALDSSHD